MPVGALPHRAETSPSPLVALSALLALGRDRPRWWRRTARCLWRRPETTRGHQRASCGWAERHDCPTYDLFSHWGDIFFRGGGGGAPRGAPKNKGGGPPPQFFFFFPGLPPGFFCYLATFETEHAPNPPPKGMADEPSTHAGAQAQLATDLGRPVTLALLVEGLWRRPPNGLVVVRDVGSRGARAVRALVFVSEQVATSYPMRAAA